MGTGSRSPSAVLHCSLPLHRVAVSRTQDTPTFGPALPPGGGPFAANADFRAFLLAKALNGEQAATHARQFHAMATRTRQQYLQDLATNEVTTTSLDSASRFGLPSLGGRRRATPRGPGTELQAAGALMWGVRAAPGARVAAGAQAGGPDSAEVPCLLGISAEALVLVAPRDDRVVFNCACRDVLAWTFSEQQLDLYHGRGEAITLRFEGDPGQAVGEVVARLQVSLEEKRPGNKHGAQGHWPPGCPHAPRRSVFWSPHHPRKGKSRKEAKPAWEFKLPQETSSVRASGLHPSFGY